MSLFMYLESWWPSVGGFQWHLTRISCKISHMACCSPLLCNTQPFCSSYRLSPWRHLSVLHLEVSVGCGHGEKEELSVKGGDEGRLPGTREGGSGLPDGCRAWPAHRAAMTILDNGGCQIGGVECKQERRWAPGLSHTCHPVFGKGSGLRHFRRSFDQLQEGQGPGWSSLGMDQACQHLYLKDTRVCAGMKRHLPWGGSSGGSGLSIWPPRDQSPGTLVTVWAASKSWGVGHRNKGEDTRWFRYESKIKRNASLSSTCSGLGSQESSFWKNVFLCRSYIFLKYTWNSCLKSRNVKLDYEWEFSMMLAVTEGHPRSPPPLPSVPWVTRCVTCASLPCIIQSALPGSRHCVLRARGTDLNKTYVQPTKPPESSQETGRWTHFHFRIGERDAHSRSRAGAREMFFQGSWHNNMEFFGPGMFVVQ